MTRGLHSSLTDITVVELGSRLSVAACGSLLAQLGATVVLVEPKTVSDDSQTKWAQRALWAAGKRSLVIDPDNATDRTLLQDLVARSDVVLTSSDADFDRCFHGLEVIPDDVIHCDLTAFGASSPHASPPLFEPALQALSGLIHTTGTPSREPVLTQLPVIEMSSAVYAAAATVAALRVRRMQQVSQRVDVSLFDCAVTMLATFLPMHFVGQVPERIGNRHPSISPWNCYRTRDGWIQICTGTEEQWRRLANLMVEDGHAVDPALNARPERMRRLDQLDALIEGWTATLPLADALARVAAAGVPCGPIYTIPELMADPNLQHRSMILERTDPANGRSLRLPGTVFSRAATGAMAIPARDEARGAAEEWRTAPLRGKPSGSHATKPSLDSIRVLEIGQWTTAPLAARLLAALGADVVKIETADRDPARGSPPLRHGNSYLFNLNNSEKRCVVIDMRSAEGKADFARLVGQCDVVIENLKPGSLARLDFPFAKLCELNPRIVYCAVSGFGAESVYEGRAAMDTVLQAMCGVMDLTRQDETPYKTGVSISDLLGGYFGLLGTLAALEGQARGGAAQFVDLSMQDLTAWLTQLSWNTAEAASSGKRILRCADGFLLASAPLEDETVLAGMRRQDAVAFLSKQGVHGFPILTVSEAAADPRTEAGGIITRSTERNGWSWPLLATPFRLEKTPARVRNAPVDIGAVGEVMQQWSNPGRRRLWALAL